MIQNLEVRKKGEGYLILDQAGSNYHADEALYDAPDRAAAEAWLAEHGADGDDVSRALDEAASAERVFIEIPDDYSKAEGFPKQ